MGNWQKRVERSCPGRLLQQQLLPQLQLQLPFPFAVKASLGTETDRQTDTETDEETDQQQIVLFVPESITHLKYKTSR